MRIFFRPVDMIGALCSTLSKAPVVGDQELMVGHSSTNRQQILRLYTTVYTDFNKILKSLQEVSGFWIKLRF